jgi:hypothetical protein
MNKFLLFIGTLIVLGTVNMLAQQVPTQPDSTTQALTLPLPKAQEEFLHHRFGVGIAHAWGDDVIGNFMLSVTYAYRFSKFFEIEANVGMMSNPFLHKIIGLDQYDLQELAKRAQSGGIFFTQSGSTLGDIGATLTPFPAPWDCVHFTAGMALLRLTGYLNQNNYGIIAVPNLLPPTDLTQFVAFQNYYFDVIRPLPFVRVSNTIQVTDRLNVDLRFGVYVGDQVLTGNPNKTSSGRVIIQYASLGAVVSYRL